jgi:hypothetical protein
LSRWYPITRDKDVVGVKFAFHTMRYQEETDSNITAFAAEAGREPAIAGAYFDITAQPAHLKTFLDAVHARGAIPYVTYDPKDWSDTDQVRQYGFIDKINQGDFDETLKAFARTLRAFDQPVLFRFAHEMNGDWYPYSGAFCGGGADADRNGIADGPENYIAAWRHVHDLFLGEGADKLVWIFCPNAETFPPEDWNRPFAYFPGTDYVDMVSVDSYESPDKVKRDLENVLEDYYNDLGLYLEAHGSDSGFVLPPFGLGEFGTYRRDGTQKGDWYDAALRYIAAEGRIKISVQYNDRNAEKNFSIAGLGARLRDAFGNSRFQFRVPEVGP